MGFCKKAPPRSRAPMPKVVMAAIVSGMKAKGMADAALQVATQHFTYIRPGALRQLKVKQLIPPLRDAGPLGRWALLLAPTLEDAARPHATGPRARLLTKTGTSDESIDLDYPPWLGPMLGAHARGRQPDEPLFTTPASRVIAAFRGLGLGLGLHGLMLYQLRHGGASDDVLSKRRSLAEVKARGRWASDSSVRRYAKPGMVQQLLGALTPSARAHCDVQWRALERILLGTPAPALPPM